MIDPDYLNAEMYDKYYGAYARFPDWFLSEIAGGRVLELACGTGRVAIPLAEAGFEVTGVDFSEPMLSLARRKARDRGVDVEWVLGDMRELSIDRDYSAVLLLSNALWHLHDSSDFEACMDVVRRHLSPQGTFYLDVFVPGLDFLTRDPARRYPAFAYFDDSGELQTVTQAYRYEQDTQIARTVHYRGKTDEVVGGLNLRMYFPRELDALLAYNGLEVVEKLGSWKREQFGPTSQHQLYRCRRA